MNFDTEQALRNEARALWERGVLTWDRRLLANDLDPAHWSDGTPTGLPASRSYGQRFDTSATLHRSAPLSAKSFDDSDNSVECTWTTGAGVLREGRSGTFNEVVDVSAKTVRLARLNAGAPFLNSHQSGTVGMVIGTVVPGSARLAGSKGVCRLTLSTAYENAGIVKDIKGGVIRNVSVGYLIHAARMIEGRNDEVPTCLVTDWEPIEISAVAIPADAGAQIRSRGAETLCFR